MPNGTRPCLLNRMISPDTRSYSVMMRDHVPQANRILPKKMKSETMSSTGGINSTNQFGDVMQTEFRLKREAAQSAYEVSKEKDRTVIRLEEMQFLAISTKDLSEDDAYWTNVQKQHIKDKYNLCRD
ncbi:hypothetical protein Tco_1336122 [Tanacetum coccineum]